MLFAVTLFSNIKIPAPFSDAGHPVNTSGDEFSPSITADSKTLVFSAKTPGNRSHNIYISKNIAGSWSTPIPVDELNSIYNDETPFISADGNTIIFASDRPGGYAPPVTSDGKVRITFDLYISRKFDNKWTKPQLLNKEINTAWNERSPSISRDGKKFFFTRWPYMNLGRSKIFMADITKEGIINVRELPEAINSGNFEIAFIPSYKSEKERYFFSSMREGGYGGWDIYYTDLEKDKFTNPVNAGAAINSEKDDLYLIEGNDFSMICSNKKGGPGGFDIFLSSTPQSKPTVITKSFITKSFSKDAYGETYIKVNVYNGATDKLIKNSKFNILLNTCTSKGCSVTRSTERISNESGYFIVRPKSDVKSIIIESTEPAYSHSNLEHQVIPLAYQEISVFFNREVSSAKESRDKFIEDEDFHLMNVYFKFNSSKIETSYYPYLYSIILKMRQNPNLSLTITGHADKLGSYKANYAVSLSRAKAVHEFITSMGIDKSRLTIENKGHSKPAQKGKLYNMDRRVEFSFNQ